MRVALERFDGSRLIKDMRQVGEDSTVILAPRRSLLDIEEVHDWMRYDKTEETHEGLPLFRQSAESLELHIDGKMSTIVPMQRDGEKAIGEIRRGPVDER